MAYTLLFEPLKVRFMSMTGVYLTTKEKVMANNRYNQPKKVDYTPREERKKVEEPTVALSPCCVCHQTIPVGYYGRHANGGTCSKKCEDNYKPGERHEVTTRATAFNGHVFSPR